MNRTPIPAHVPFCHKNYDIAEKLCEVVDGLEAKKPWNIEQKPWEAIKSSFEAWFSTPEVDKTQNEWDTVESFFQHLIDQAEKGEQTPGEGEALASIDSDLEGDSKKESKESILDLTEALKDRETKELAEQTLRLLESTSMDKVRKYKSVVDAAMTAALTRRRGSSNELPDYKTFSSQTASLKEFGRINEKVNFHPAMKSLSLYRAINEELTAIKPIVEKPRELFILIDDSGSMNKNEKRAIVNLVILEGKKRASQGITVFCHFFEADLYDRDYDLACETPRIGFNGGSTDVEKSLITLSKHLRPGSAVLVVNDGEDKVSDSFKPACKMVALTLFNENEGLEKAALKSGGKYFTV